MISNSRINTKAHTTWLALLTVKNINCTFSNDDKKRDRVIELALLVARHDEPLFFEN